MTCRSRGQAQPRPAAQPGTFRKRTDGRWEAVTPLGQVVTLCALRVQVIEQGGRVTLRTADGSPGVRVIDPRLGPVSWDVVGSRWIPR